MSTSRIEDVYPLSALQEGMLFHSLLDPESGVYLTQLSCQLERLDATVFEEAWKRVVERNPVLRTAFVWKRTEAPLQVVGRQVSLPWRREDWRGLSAQDRRARLESHLSGDARQPFDLNRAPLMRFALFREGEDEYHFVWTHHHLLLDGWSLPLLLGELSALYDALRRGAAPVLPSRRPYRDFIAWSQAQNPARAEGFWREILRGFNAATPLGVDRPSRAAGEASPESRDATASLPATATRTLAEVARRHGLTLGTLVATAWAVLLNRYSGEDDLVFGVTVSGRPPDLPGVEAMVGNFINTLPLRLAVPGDEPVLSWARSVQQRQVEIREHEHSSLVLIQGCSGVPRNEPLFESILFFQNYPLEDRPAAAGDGFGLRDLRVNESTNYPLIVVVAPRVELVLRIEYLRHRFDRPAILRMLGHLSALLGGIAREPEGRVRDLSLLTESERHQTLLEWNDSDDPACGRPFPRLFEATLRRTPDAVAAVSREGILSYRELDRRTEILASRLAERGCGPETIVAVLTERGPGLLTAVLAAFRTGAAYLPLDPAHPPARLRQILSRSGAGLVLVADDLFGKLAEALSGLPPTGIPQVLRAEPREEGGAPPSRPLGMLDGLAYVIYTSGSTGLPKGAMIAHRGMVNHLFAKILDLGLTAADRIAQNASQCFDISVWQLLAAAVVGGAVHILEDEVAHDPERLLDAVEQQGITILEMVPSLLRAVLDEVERRGEARLPLTRLRWLIPTGEALPPDLCLRWARAYPHVPMLNAYGPTECSDDVTHWPVASLEEGALTPIGRPVINMRLYVLDRNQAPLPLGVAGELYVGGEGVGRGYLGEPVRTAGTFLPDPLAARSGARLYRTGDLARTAAGGEIEFLGRIDHQVKVRGYRIELGEIETALRQHPEVGDCVVAAREEETGERRLVGYVVPRRAEDEAEPQLAAGKVGEWRAVFDEVYSHGAVSARDSAINLRVWVSSYTGQPLPEDEIVECFEDSVERILALQPSHVLEIGCGTGLLLHRIAPHCASYLATDLSGEVLRDVSRRAEEASLGHVTFLERAADDFAGIPPASFDVVVLNEVVQYFPSAGYLVKVLAGALAAVKPGGVLFVGGVRSLPLLAPFAASVQRFRAPGSMEVAELRRRIHGQLAGEKELAVDPRLFLDLAGHLPAAGGVWFQLKGGRHHNELTRFRYDVFLRMGGRPVDGPAPSTLSWREEEHSLGIVRRHLEEQRPGALRISGIPNARVREELLAMELIHLDGGPATVAELGRALEDGGGGVDPADLRDLGGELGYQVFVSWAASGEADRIDAVFTRPGADPLPAAAASELLAESAADRSWSRYGNDPVRRDAADDLIPRLRVFLAERLPAYMVPEAMVLLDALPLTPNGKVDRRSLPPDGGRPDLAAGYAPPGTPMEELLAGIWSQLLGVARIGIHDNFFDLGGHSLKATQLVSRVRQVLEIELPLRRLFEAPTVAGLARVIEEIRGAERPFQPPSIARMPRDRPLPLSFAQERLWFVDQFAPGGSVYNVPLLFRSLGRLDEEALAEALGEIVRRHEALRTTYRMTGGRPAQVVEDAAPFVLPRVDLTALSASRREEEVRRWAVWGVRAPFQLERGPVVRAVLLRLGADEHHLVMATHHIAFDGSYEVFVRELVTLYRSFSRGEPSPLPEPAVQYADFAFWQREWLRGEVLESLLSYWREKLEGRPPVLELPTDRPRPAVLSSRGASRLFALPAEITEGVRALGRQEGSTLFITMLAAFKVLLSRYTGQTDLSVGSPVMDRTRAEIEEIIGCFVNTVVLRTRFAEGEGFAGVVRRTRETSLGAYAHQDLPFEALVENLQPERNLSYTPLFQVMFVLLNASALATDLELPGLVLSRPQSDRGTARFDILFGVWEEREVLTGTVEYNTDLFDAATIQRLLAHYENLLRSALTDPRRPVAELPLLSAAERHQALLAWNDTAAREEESVCIHELFEVRAAAAPEAVAAESGRRRLTYGELNRQANRLAHHLRSRGAGPGTWVAVYMERSLEMVEAVLGVLKAGAAYVPLEPVFPPERIERILTTLGIAHVVTQTDRMPVLDELACRPGLLDVICLDAPGALAGHSPKDPEPLAGPESMAYAIFTSGSTGSPKGVMVRHRPVVNLIGWVNETFAVGPGDRVLFTTSLCFDLSVYDIFGLLAAGGTIRLADREDLDEPARLVRILAREPITFWDSAPAALQRLVPLFAPEGAPFAGSPLRLVFLSGDWIPVTLPGAVRESFPTARVISLGGATEATIWSNFHPEGEPDPSWVSVPYGRPIRNARYHVLDDGLRPCPVGVAGDLYIGGDCLAAGYAADPPLTAGKFIPDPFPNGPGDRLYRTGDRARYRPGGNLEFLGRLDHQVKIRGHRIELGEIESVLGQHPAVRTSAVLAREDLPGGKALVAYVVPADSPGLGAEGLREFLRQRLPEYMLPAAFVFLESLPVTANGKLDRKALPVPEQVRPEVAHVPACTVYEEVLAGIWSEVLGVEKVGTQEDFFGLGGHSLLAAQLLARVRRAFSLEIPLRLLFEAPTVQALAAEIEAAVRAGGVREIPPITPIPRGLPLPLSFAQRRLWLLDRLEPGSPAYNIPFALKLAGPLRPAVLAQAFSEVASRHEVLRTTFADSPVGPSQVIEPPGPVPLPVCDLRGLAPEIRQAEAQRLVEEEALRPLDLARGPVLRTTLLALEDERHALLVTVHHIAGDAWSMEILVREVAEVYRAALAGEKPRLPALPVQYADYANWQHGWLQGEALEALSAHWRERLAGVPPALDLPLDHPRPRLRTARGGTVSFALPRQVVEVVRRSARAAEATPFMVLLTAFEALLYRLSNQEDFCLGTPVANRHRTELEDLIGFFVSTVVLRAGLEGDPGLTGLLARVRETALTAFAHQDLPFEKLVEELALDRDLRRPPLFQVLFSLRNVRAAIAALPGLEIAGWPQDAKIAQFDLTCALSDLEDGFEGAFEYDAALFDRATAERWVESFSRLLSAALADPECPVSALPMLSVEQRAQLLSRCGGEETEYPAELGIHQLVEAQASRTPEAIAVELAGKRWTYRELDRRANRLAHHLRSLGVEPEVPVAICLRRTLDLPVAILGVLKAGGVYVPLDPSLPSERLAHMLAETGAPVILSEAAVSARLPRAAAERALDLARLDLAALADTPPPPRGGGEGLAYVIFTSGSMGRPKGVQVPHRALINHAIAVAERYGLHPGDRVLQFASIGFDLALEELFPAWLRGGAVVLRQGESLPSFADLLRILREEDMTVLSLPTAYWQEWVADLGSAAAPPESLRLLVVGTETASADRWRAWREKAGERVRLINAYGPTEATITATVWEGSATGLPGPRVPIGQPLRNVQAYVLDRHLEPVLPGVTGELHLGGAGIARGYLGAPGATAATFLPDPFSGRPGARLYRTGDLARSQAGGDLEVLGRADRQVKLHGVRIEPGEIEQVLARHPGVRGAVVALREEGQRKRLVAYVAAEACSVEELRRRAEEALPASMVPSSFVLLPNLPLTASGKVDLQALPAPEPAKSQGRHAAAPRTPIEELVARICAEVLGMEAVAPDDNFFELGGHSLLAAQVVSRIRAALGVELPLRELFEAPTIAALAERLSAVRRESAPAPRVRPAPRTQALPLSYGQERLWFVSQLDPGTSLYNIPEAVRITGALDLALLDRCFREIGSRHEILRTTFPEIDGGVVQRIAAAPALELARVDLGGLAAPAREREARRLAAGQALRPFDLVRGPLWRVTLLRMGDGEHVAVLVLHHIVADAWSVRILLRELLSLYGAWSRGETSPLPELPLQYADMAAWQREWLRGDTLETLLASWSERLAQAPEEIDLPTDLPREDALPPRGAIEFFLVGEPVLRTLEALARAEGATLFMTLLAAFQVLLGRYSGQEDLVVGTYVSNRGGETEDLIGLFVNTLALRADLSGGPTFRELLRQVRETTLDAYAHQDLPFERLVERLRPARRGRRNPLFQVGFNFENVPEPAAPGPSDLAFSPFAISNPSAPLDLLLELTQTPEGLRGSFRYDARLFREATVHRLADHLCGLLANIGRDPDCGIFALPLLVEGSEELSLNES
ncbi:MAG TPA: amino acid adenylation domain-containing protein [Thermoanaerobaculia bacterium]|nr:amino acid adenylation domain-containing protein [Thermoanaerobaculia bacterium]